MGNIILDNDLRILSYEEERRIDGGSWYFGTLITLGVYLFDNRDRFIEGVKDGINDFIE